MPQPKADEWEDVDSQWEDIDFEDVPAAKPPSSFLKSVYDSTFTAPKFITDITGEVPEGGITDAFKAIPDVASGLWNHPFETISGGLKGAVQGAGAQLSPANVISTAVPYVKPIKAAAPFVNAVLGAGQVTKGASEILEGDVSTGLGNIGFGALGVGTAGKFPSRKGNLSKIATAADDIPPGGYKPTPDFKDNANSKRYYELVEKSRNGTLTGDELIEARKLDKIVREEQYTPEPIKDLPETVVIKKPTSGYLKRLKEQGYEPAGTSKDGFPQMKLKKADDWEDILSTMEEEVPAAKSIEVVDDDIISTVGSPKPLDFEKGVLKKTNNQLTGELGNLTPDELDMVFSDKPIPGPKLPKPEMTPEVAAMHDATEQAMLSEVPAIQDTANEISPGKPRKEYPGYKGQLNEPPLTPEIKRIVDTYQLDPDEVVDLLGGPISKETVGAPPSKYKSPKPVPPPNPQVKRVINKTPEQIKQTVPQDELPKIMRSLDDEIEFARTQPPEVQKTLYRKIMDTQKAVLTGYDTSFIGRQGRGLITHKGYWNAFADLRAALGSDEAAKLASQAIIDHPSGYFKSTIDPDTGKTIAPFAERMGLKLSDVFNTENMSSNWAETGGNIPYFSRAYRESAGRLFKATQRGNLAFINKAKADVFVSLMGQLKRRGINPLLDEVTSRQVAKSINSSTGKGSFGKWENPTLNLETKQLEASTTMRVLNEVFLSPQFMKSRFDMYNRILNPVTGAFAPWSNMDRTVRIEAVRSLAGIVGSALLIQELARMAGAKIIDDPTNPDYRKVIVGNTRMDNMAGIQQYGVGMTQFFTGQTTSSTSGRTSELVGGFGNRAPSYGAKNTADVVGNFLVNRFALIPSMLMAWMRGTDFDNKPFEFKRALANRISPLVAQDIMELVKEDPELFPFAIAPVVGEGLQTYGR